MMNAVPEGVLLEILSAVPAPDLICRCRPVCTLWRNVIDSSALWKTKCQRDGFILRRCRRIPPDWRMFYFLHLRKKNLLKNPIAEENFKYWHKKEDGGDHWKVETLPGAHGRPFPDEKVKKYYVTSYHWCLKSQTINLKKEGYPNEFMDIVQPNIIIKDWYSARHDCGSQYTIHVQLLSHDKTVIAEFKPDPVRIEQWSTAEWAQIEYTFRMYGPGVRYIYFEHGGCDTQFWAGWYGIRVTNSSVTIDPGDLST
ncbi:F-box only protein 6-like isoform X2 [Hyla sarda]|nr:F-box only protein 6-like isoform X2 [Hyla sarda]XP_056398197.1 F-box only protein 6-like isoform X2 [Hyla sarda]XP_056398198.1 F-box only protein 6-like isoform X2 [Hyla sarda]XP_056398199.1 F-box only protein 6-like isoform X2 [Hyla sarda]